VAIKTTIFWAVTQCNPKVVYRRFGRTYFSKQENEGQRAWLGANSGFYRSSRDFRAAYAAQDDIENRADETRNAYGNLVVKPPRKGALGRTK
jgi:hypothetical protein